MEEVGWCLDAEAPLVKCVHHQGGALVDSIVGLGESFLAALLLLE